jgi:hypothetical protein
MDLDEKRLWNMRLTGREGTMEIDLEEIRANICQ